MRDEREERRERGVVSEAAIAAALATTALVATLIGWAILSRTEPQTPVAAPAQLEAPPATSRSPMRPAPIDLPVPDLAPMPELVRVDTRLPPERVDVVSSASRRRRPR